MSSVPQQQPAGEVNVVTSRAAPAATPFKPDQTFRRSLAHRWCSLLLPTKPARAHRRSSAKSDLHYDDFGHFDQVHQPVVRLVRPRGSLGFKWPDHVTTPAAPTASAACGSCCLLIFLLFKNIIIVVSPNGMKAKHLLFRPPVEKKASEGFGGVSARKIRKPSTWACGHGPA